MRLIDADAIMQKGTRITPDNIEVAKAIRFAPTIDAVMELKVRDIKSLNMLVEALYLNGYKLQTEVVYKSFPKNELIDHFKVNVEEGADNG